MRGINLLAACPLSVALLLSSAFSASAANPTALPKHDFPKNAKITYLPSVSNTDLDSSWSVDQYGNPVFHMTSQDSLHRTGGWVQEGVIKSKMIWVIVSNAYEPGTDATDVNHFAAKALSDFGATLQTTGWASASRSPSLYPTSAAGTTIIEAIQLGQGFSGYTIGVQVGNDEIEGVALYISHRNLSSLAWNDLVKQMRDAVILATAPPQASQGR